MLIHRAGRVPLEQAGDGLTQVQAKHLGGPHPGASHILLFVSDASSNAMSRAHGIRLAAHAAGYGMSVIAMDGQALWEPIKNTALSRDLVRRSDDPRDLGDLLEVADVYIAMKPLRRSFGFMLRCAELVPRPVLIDIDDPDIEVRLGTPRGAGKVLLKRDLRQDGGLLELARLSRRARSVTRMVSNPVLQERWGGTVVPNASGLQVSPAPLHDSRCRVAFFGTVREHKGIPLLRQAVADLARDGFTVTITADPPRDARPWERWIGTVPLAEVTRRYAEVDVIAVPTVDGPIGGAQLPVKLTDAMMAGKPIVASDLPPVRWALADTGILVEPGSVAALSAGLRRLGDEEERRRLSAAARARAEALFSPVTVGARLKSAIDEARGSGSPAPSSRGARS